MANKNINILMKLTDQFTKPMLKATNATKAQTKAVQAAQQKTVSFVNKANNKFLSLAKGIGRAALAVTGLTGAFSLLGLKRFASEAIELANAQQQAETKLETLLWHCQELAAGGNEEIKRAKKYLVQTAKELQKVGIIGDEVTLAGMQQLATYQMNDKQIALLSKGMADLLAQTKGVNATQEDAVSTANLIGKAMNGQVGALTRVGIIMTEEQKQAMKVGDAEQRAAVLAEILEQNVGGVNKALADTPLGQIKQTQNAWGDMMESIGAKLIPIKAQLYSFVGQYIPDIQKAATGLIDKLSPLIDKFTAWFSAHTGDIKAALQTVKKILLTIWKIVKPILNFCVEHAETIIKVIAAIGAAFVAINIVMKIMQVVQVVQTLISICGPIPLIIAAVIIVLILIVKNWDKIKAKVIEVVNKIKAKMQPLIDWIKKVWNNVKTVVLAIWDAIVSKIQTAINKIKSIIQTVKDAITAAFNAIKNVVSGIFDGPIEAAKNLYNWVSKLITKFKDWLDVYSGNNGGLSPSGLVTTGNATGTPYWRGGPTRINEGGRGEIVDLPNGTRIIPHDVAKNATGGTTVNVNLTVAGNVIGNREFMEATGEYVSQKVINALGVV